MMKKFTIIVCLFLLFTLFGFSVCAEEGDKNTLFDLTFSDGSKAVTDAGCDENGVADTVKVTVCATADTLSDILLRINFDGTNFKFENGSVNTHDGKLTVLSTFDGSYENYVLLGIKVNTPLEKSETPAELVTLSFSCTAGVDKDKAYAFSVSPDGEIPKGVTFAAQAYYTVSHVHDFTAWEKYADATETEPGSETRTCKTCNRVQRRETGGVDYGFTVNKNAKHITYDTEKACLYGMETGITAKELLSALKITESMRISGAYPIVHDVKGISRKDGDALHTGDVLALCGKSGKIYKSIQIAVLGDADGNGTVTAADARAALRFAVSLDTPSTSQSFAVDCDGTKGISAADARLILRVSVKLDVFYRIALESLKVSPSSLLMLVGDTEYITPIFSPTDATDKKLSYKSSDTSVAIVNNGTITAVGCGTATITVTGSGNKTATCTVTVRNVRFSREKYFLEENSVLNLLSVLTYNSGDLAKATLNLSNWNDFTVNASGQVQCKTAYDSKKSIDTTVYLTLQDGRKLTTEVELIPAGASVCTFNMPSLLLIAGDSSFRLNSVMVNSTATAVLSSSDNTIVSYDNATGKLTPLKAGTAYITCTNTNYSEKLKITVVKAEKMFHLIGASIVQDTSANAWNLRIQFANLSGKVIESVSFSVRPRNSAKEILDDLAVTVTASSVEPHALSSNGVTFGWKGVWQSAADIDSFQIRMITVNYTDGTVGYILGNGVNACKWD